MDEIEAILIGAIIGAIIGSMLTGAIGWILDYRKRKQKQKNIAKSLLFEITEIDDLTHKLTEHLKELFKTPLDVKNPKRIPQRLCFLDGVFFTYRKEIASFNNDLSSDLNKYFSLLQRAESERTLILDILGRDKINENDRQVALGSTIYMVKCLYELDALTAKLKSSLQIEINKIL